MELTEIAKFLFSLSGLAMGFLVLTITQYAKMFIGKEKQDKIVPVLAVAIGGVIGIAFKQVLMGIIMGGIVSESYHILIKIFKSIGREK